MKKHIIQWILISVIAGILLYGTISSITNTIFNNLFGEFEIMLMIVGFLTLSSTIIICTKIIVDKMGKAKRIE